MNKWLLTIIIPLSTFILLASNSFGYEPAGNGLRILESESGVSIRMLVEQSNLDGTEVEVGHITFPAGNESISHSHSVTEIFYVISGELEHVVNGESHLIKPGMVGIVRPGDEIIHRVPGTVPCEALVIWAPGGEAERLATNFRSRPID